MKLLILSQDFPPRRGGIASYAFELARSLARVAEVTVLAPGEGASEGFTRRRVSLPCWSPLAVLAWRRALRSALRENPAAHVFCTNWYPCGLAAWSTGHAYHLCAHGAELLRRPGALQAMKQFFRRRVLRSAAGVFPGSHYAAGLVRALGRSETAVLSYGVDSHRFRPAAPRAGGQGTVLTVCRLDPHKGVDTALAALAIRTQAGRPFRYVVAGEGVDGERLRRIARELGVADHVSFLGAVSDEVVSRLYQDCDVFLMVSRPLTSFVEGFGMVFLEAAACAKPAVGSLAGGIPEAVIDGETGLLVPPGDATLTARALGRLLDEDSLRARLGANALRRAREEMSWDHVARRLKEGISPGHG